MKLSNAHKEKDRVTPVFFLPRSARVYGIAIATILAMVLPFPGIDWIIFRNAVLKMIAGESPFVPGYMTAPWILVPLIPLAILPVNIGLSILRGVYVISVAYFLKDAKWWVTLSVFMSYPFVKGVVQGQIDWMILLGVFIPQSTGLTLLLAKPQIGLGVAIHIGIQAIREKRLIKTFAPVVALYLISFSVYGLWITSARGVIGTGWNVSIFPYGAPLGLLMLFSANKKHLLAAGPLLSPYVGPSSYLGVLLGLQKWRYAVILCALSWLL